MKIPLYAIFSMGYWGGLEKSRKGAAWGKKGKNDVLNHMNTLILHTLSLNNVITVCTIKRAFVFCCNYIHVTVQLVHHSHLGLPKNGLVDTGDLRGELMATGESIGPGGKIKFIDMDLL